MCCWNSISAIHPESRIKTQFGYGSYRNQCSVVLGHIIGAGTKRHRQPRGFGGGIDMQRSARRRDINDSSSTIAAAVEQQGSATNEIVQAVNQASMGTQEVTSNITGVARMAEETGAGAAQVLSASGELAQQAANLRNQINSFLAHVRAA
jgi:ABC-type transporter Mla subunit MlaD